MEWQSSFILASHSQVWHVQVPLTYNSNSNSLGCSLNSATEPITICRIICPTVNISSWWPVPSAPASSALRPGKHRSISQAGYPPVHVISRARVLLVGRTATSITSAGFFFKPIAESVTSLQALPCSQWKWAALERSRGPMDLKLLNLRFSGPASHLGFRKRNDPSEPPCFFGPVLLERLSGGAVPPAALGSGTRSMHSGKRWTVQKGNYTTTKAPWPSCPVSTSIARKTWVQDLFLCVSRLQLSWLSWPKNLGQRDPKGPFKTTHICQDWGVVKKLDAGSCCCWWWWWWWWWF